MTAFTAQVSQNQYLAQGADLVHAVMSITSERDATAARSGTLVEALLVDCSGSMDGEKVRHAKSAIVTTIDLLREETWFCVISGSSVAHVICPLAQATPAHKAEAKERVRRLTAQGGTAMSTWLEAAGREFHKMPGAIHHALLLTDGKNESEPDDKLAAVVRACEGEFQCDARGVGTDWVPDQLRMISGRLLGTVDIIPQPSEIAADFRRVIEQAMGKSVREVLLRLWTPVGARVEFCRLVYPETVDLSDRARPDPRNPQVRDYPTGSWGEEKRDYHLCIRVSPGQVGQKMCAGRASLVIVEGGQETKVSEALILAVWTDDEAQSAVIHPAVAHYTGQAELADAIQQGLKAREAGDDARATALLGRAVQIAARSNPETMKLLRKVVEVEDEAQGTVKLKKGVKKEDEFALDTRSTKTARVSKGG
ncbi:MAG: VWA domain-containing protein [Planctomycetaceae bacterium]|nr:VWA domain-containing protein [Planctomycetaceae bacterium]